VEEVLKQNATSQFVLSCHLKRLRSVQVAGTRPDEPTVVPLITSPNVRKMLHTLKQMFEPLTEEPLAGGNETPTRAA
jgi:hypothetical protein